LLLLSLTLSVSLLGFRGAGILLCLIRILLLLLLGLIIAFTLRAIALGTRVHGQAEHQRNTEKRCGDQLFTVI
jgi:hypothetical protein